MTREATRLAVSHQFTSIGKSCPIARAASLLGDVWTLLLLRDLAQGPRRFSELEHSTGISPRVLTDRLRGLVARDILTRHMFSVIPPRVEYSLTDKGRAALPVLECMRAYGEDWLADGPGPTELPDDCPQPTE